MTALGQGGPFKGRQVTSEVTLWALRWYLAPISDSDLASMLAYAGTVEDPARFARSRWSARTWG